MKSSPASRASMSPRPSFGPQRRRRARSIIATAVAAALSVMISVPAARAADIAWDGDSTATTGNWTDVENWSGGAAPADSLATDIALFNLADYAATGLSQPSLDTAIKVAGLKIQGAGALTLGGAQPLTLGSGGIAMSSTAGAATINAPLVLGAAQSWTNESANLLTLGGTIDNGGFLLTIGGSKNTTFGSASSMSGAGGLTKDGAGILTLGGANTFTGALTIANGEVVIGNTGALNATAPVALKFDNNANTKTLTLDGNSVTVSSLSTGATVGTTTIKNVKANTTSILTVNSALNETYGGKLEDSTAATAKLSLVKDGSGTLTLTADPNLHGAFTVKAGILELNHSGSTDAHMAIESGATLRTLLGVIGDSYNIAVDGTYDIRTSDTINQLTGTGVVTNGGASSITLTVLNATTSGSVTFGGTLDSGTAGGTLGLTKNGTGSTLILTNTSTLTGTVTAGSGIIELRGDNAALVSATDGTKGSNQITLNRSDTKLIVGNSADTNATLNRLRDTAEIELQDGAEVVFNGVNSTSTTAETFGQLESNNGRNKMTLNPYAGREIVVTSTKPLRSNDGTLLFRGKNLGSPAGTADSSRIFFSDAAALTQFVGGGGAAGTTNQSILPYAVGDTSSTGSGNSLVTYDAINGLRPLADAEYAASIAAGTSTNNVSASSALTVGANSTINALRLQTDGGVTIAPRRGLTITSGAILSNAAATIAGPGILNLGSANAVIHHSDTAASTTAINSNITGTGSLTISANNAVGIVALGGSNSLTGTISVNHGILRLDSPNALNPLARNALRFASEQASGEAILRLNGNTIYETLASQQRGTIENASATPATLWVNQTADLDDPIVLNNGTGSGALSFGRTGTNRLSLQSSGSMSGDFIVQSGTLEIKDSARFTAARSVIVEGGTFQLYNTDSQNQNDRLPSAADVLLRGGTFSFNSNSSTNADFSEGIGQLRIEAGVNAVFGKEAGTGRKSVVAFNETPTSGDAYLYNRVRNEGAVLSFTGTNIGTSLKNRIRIGPDAGSSTPTAHQVLLTNGILGGWATIGDDFVTLSGDLDTGTSGVQHSVTTLTTYQAGLDATAWGSTENVKPSAALTTNLAAAKTINSLILPDTVNFDLNGQALTLTTGGLLSVNTSTTVAKTISNGSLTAGTGAAPGELVIRTGNSAGVLGALDLSANIIDNGAQPVAFTKWGAGNLSLTGAGNTFTGSLNITQGSLIADSAARLGGGTGRTLRIAAGGTLDLSAGTAKDALTQFSAIESSTIGNATLRAARNGTQKLDYAGSIVGIGSVTFANTVNATIANAINLRGGLFIGEDDTVAITTNTALPTSAFTVGNYDHVIGGSLYVGMDQRSATLTQQTGGTMSVGLTGIGNNLYIGVREASFDPASSTVATTGLLDLSATANFTARVDRVRIGVITAGTGGNSPAKGDLVLGQDSTLIAGTQIILAESGASGLEGVESTITFGSGNNLVQTPQFVVGGSKGKAKATVKTGGTINLAHFDGRGADLIVGRNTAGTGTASNGTFDMTGGTLAANIGQLIVGLKSGGPSGTALGGAVGSVTLTGNNNDVNAASIILGSFVETGTATSLAKALGEGTLNFGGGTFAVAGDVQLGIASTAANAQGAARGTLNLTGGAFTVAGNITKTDSQRSSALITVNSGSLNLQPAGDDTPGTITASQIRFLGGSIVNAASATLDGRAYTNSTTFTNLDEALILGDVNFAAPVNLTNGTANKGGIRYQGTTTGAALAGAVNLGTVNRTFNVDRGSALVDLAITGKISGTGGLDKTGAGKLRLAGVANDFSGPTTVTAGTLLIDGGLTATASVAATGTTSVLGGTGDGLTTGLINAPVTIAGGAKLTAGDVDSIGILTTGALTLGAGGKVVVNVAALPGSSTAGAGWDLIQYASLDVTATNADPFTILLTGDAPGFTAETEYKWKIGQHLDSGAITNFDPTRFIVDTTDFAPLAGAPATITAEGNDLFVSASAVPEPSTLGLIALAGLTLMRRRVRRA